MKGSTADKEERQRLENVKVLDNQNNKMDFFLFSRQVDTLCKTINEFDHCFEARGDQKLIGAN